MEILENPTVENPKPKEDFFRARRFIVAEQEERGQAGLPVWVPSCTCSSIKIYGHEISSKCALATESEFKTIVGLDPKTLNVEPFPTDFSTPGLPCNYYAISLAGLPDDLKYTLKIVKCYYRVEAVKDEQHLRPETQLSAKQSGAVFDFVHGKYQAARPAGVVNQTFPTLEHLRQKAAKIEEALQNALAMKKHGQSSQQPKIEQDAETLRGAQSLMEGFTTEAEPSSKRRKKQKLPAETGPSLLALHDRDRDREKSDATPADAKTETASAAPSVPSSKRRKGGSLHAELDDLDSELRKVAEVHIANGGTSARGLKDLVVKNFAKGSDHVTGHAVSSETWLKSRVLELQFQLEVSNILAFQAVAVVPLISVVCFGRRPRPKLWPRIWWNGNPKQMN